MRVNMLKCNDYLPNPKDSVDTQAVARRVAETVIAGLLILMMAACNVGANDKRSVLAPEVAARAQPESSLGDQRWSAAGGSYSALRLHIPDRST
jgi:hypothetical protein